MSELAALWCSLSDTHHVDTVLLKQTLPQQHRAPLLGNQAGRSTYALFAMVEHKMKGFLLVKTVTVSLLHGQKKINGFTLSSQAFSTAVEVKLKLWLVGVLKCACM